MTVYAALPEPSFATPTRLNLGRRLAEQDIWDARFESVDM
jgi:hypothetical protein